MWHIYVFDNNSTTKDKDSSYSRRQSIATALGSLCRDDITIVHNRNVFDTSKIPDTNMIDCNSVEYFTLIEPFILFIHTNNACFVEFVKNILVQDLQCLVVCYSGGSKSSDYNDLIKNFPNKENISFIPHIGAIITHQELSQRWNIKAFIDTAINNKQNPFDYLVYKIPSHLIALSILCQEYLAAHGKIEQLEKLTIPEYVKEETEKQKQWLQDVIKDVSDLKNKIGKELESIGKNVEDIQLIQLIIDKDQEYFDKNEKLKEEKIGEFTNSVENTNRELTGIIQG